MNEGVKDSQVIARPEAAQSQELSETSRVHFQRLEAAKEHERDARIRAEMQAEQMRREIEDIKRSLKPPEADPLDGVDDYVDVARLKQKLEKERATYERRAEEIARKTIEDERKKEHSSNFLQRLKNEYSDFDQVMNESNIAELEQTDPIFLRAVLKNPDEYERRKDAYEFIKAKKQKQVAPTQVNQTIQGKIEENQRNPFFIPSGTGQPSAVDYDLKSKSSRELAYAKLKQAQKRPIGQG